VRVVSAACVLVASILPVVCAATDGAHADSAKYNNAIAVRKITDACNIYKLDVKSRTCMSASSIARFKEAFERMLKSNGYLATATPKYYVDVDIREIRISWAPIVGVEVVSNITYTVSGAGSGPKKYPVQATGNANIVSMPIGLLRAPVAYAMSFGQNVKQFIRQLR